MKRKSGFTLVEMLVVVVIIGILSAALIPRLTGYMARTRDLKRHADLRNIAGAITMYKNDHGEFPVFEKSNKGYKPWTLFNSVTKLSSGLSKYISKIPTDPLKNSQIDICDGTHRVPCKELLKKGTYLYTLQKEANSLSLLPVGDTLVLLVAKVETPEYANHIIFDYNTEIYNNTGNSNIRGYANGNDELGYYPSWLGKELMLCDNIKKGDFVGYTKNANGRYDCIYSSEDQLYYVLKIE